MKRIDILICLELFNIRKQKSYPKNIIKDSYEIVRGLCCAKFVPVLGYNRATNFKEFQKELRAIYLKKSPIEFRYCQEFLDYLDKFSAFVVSNLF